MPHIFFFPPWKTTIYLPYRYHFPFHEHNQPGRSVFVRSLSYSSAVNKVVTNALANLVPASFLVTPLINTTHLTGWWHIKGKRQSLCGKTCWLTTILAHTGKTSKTELSIDNQPNTQTDRHTHTVKFESMLYLFLRFLIVTSNRHVSYLFV